jgi:hypothetical protein
LFQEISDLKLIEKVLRGILRIDLELIRSPTHPHFFAQRFFQVPLMAHTGTSGSNASVLPGFAALFGSAVLVIIRIIIIVLVASLALVILPAIILAIIEWFLTGSFFYAGIAFLVVALISLVKRI